MDRLLLKDFRSNMGRGLKLVKLLNFDRNCMVGPIRVEVAATSACTYQCCFCGAHSYLKTSGIQPQIMSEEVIHNLITDLRNLRIKELLFSGNGEPLLSKALIKEIKQNGRHFKIEVLSNGSTLESVDEQLFRNLFYLTISLNSGNGASHQVTHGYRGHNRFFETTEHIERILKFENAHNKVKLNYAITTDNYNEIDDFFEKAIQWNVSFMARPVAVDFPELKSKGLDDKMLDCLNHKALEYLKNRSLPNKLALSFRLVSRACNIHSEKNACERLDTPSRLYPCYMSFIQPYIASNGDVLLCCGGSEKSLGNINDHSFLSIWQKKENLALRIMGTQMHKTNRPVLSVCPTCTDVRYHSLAFHSIYSRVPLLSSRLAARIESSDHFIG